MYDSLRHGLAAIAMALLAAPAIAQGSGQLNLICSVQDAWCSIIASSFSRGTGVKVNMVKRGSGEALAQLIAERARPRADVWFGGTGDPHRQAAELDLTQAYQSPHLDELHGWAQEQARQSSYRTVGVYSGPLGFAFNTELLARKKLDAPRCWKDLTHPAFKGALQVANPASSGTAYTMIATLVQLMGEDKAFEYLQALNKNVSQYPRSGTGPIKAVARGDAMVSVSFMQDAPGERMKGFPIAASAPCEGTGAEVGSMSLIKGAPNPGNAKTFYEWALTPAAQQLAVAVKQFHLQSHKATPVDGNTPDFQKIRFVHYDYAKYGTAAERQRLIDRWEHEVNAQPR